MSVTVVFPACAGMNRRPYPARWPTIRVPRMRGDEPVMRRAVNQAPRRVPRMRGDEPAGDRVAVVDR